MADNVAITAGAGTSVGTDDIAGVHYQKMKVYDGTADSTNPLVVDALGRIGTKASVTRVSVTPTISTTAYGLKDCVGSFMTFTSAIATSGGWGRVQRVQIADLDAEVADLDLVLFDRDISGTTTATDNAAFDLADGDVGKVIGIVPVSSGFYGTFNDNAVADVPCDLRFKLNGTAIYGLLIARSTPTYTSTGDLVVTITVAED